MDLVNISAEMAQGGSVFDRVDMIVMPGGSSKNEMTSLGAAGQANLISYIRKGGTYYGTCAGSHLVLADELNISGYTRNSYYDGGDTVDIAFNAEGMATLGLSKDTWGVRYHRGPFIVDSSPVEGADLKVWGIYTNTDIVAASGADNRMEGKYAVLAGSYFDGRMLVIASHPESNVENYPFVRQVWRWLSGRDDITVESKQMSGFKAVGCKTVFYVSSYSQGIYPLAETMLKADDDPRMNLVAAGSTSVKTGTKNKYVENAIAFLAESGADAAAYHRTTYTAAMNAIKDRGGLVLFTDDGYDPNRLWATVDALASDDRAEKSVPWEEGRKQSFTGDRTFEGLDLRVSEPGAYVTTFRDGAFAFNPNGRGLGGDWVYCASNAFHTVRIENAVVSAVHGNHRRNSYMSVTSGGTYSPIASNRFEIALGARNVEGGAAALSFGKAFAVATGSTLAVDARGKGKGTYKLIEAESLTVKSSAFMTSATVQTDAGIAAVVSKTGDAVVLVLTDATTLYKVDYVSSSGAAYVDTGIDVQDKMTLDLDFMWTKLGGGDANYAGMFGALRSADPVLRFYMVNVGSTHSWRGSIASANATAYTDLPVAEANTRYRIVTTVDGKEETQDLNGEIRKLTFSVAQTHQDGITCFLGAYRNIKSTGDTPNGRWPCRIYGAKIYTNSTDVASGVLAREYVPCYSPSARKYGLWESVTGTFVPSLAGDFGGADVPATPELIDTSRPEEPGEDPEEPGEEPGENPEEPGDDDEDDDWEEPVDPGQPDEPPADPGAWKKLYQPVQYIRSAGSQFVNTGIQMQDKLTLDIDYEWTAGFLNYAVLFGSFAAEGDKEYRCYLGYVTTAGIWRAVTETSTSSAGTVTALGEALPDTRYHLVQTVNGKVVKFTVNGGTTCSKTCTAAQKAHPYDMYLFAHRTSGEKAGGSSSMKLYSAKIWTNSVEEATRVLARDYRPCREKATGLYGVYDVVTGTFHPSDGPEGFFGPLDVKGFSEVDYIESTGKQFVDTGINQQDQLTVDLAYMWTESTSEITAMFGSYNSGGEKTYRNYIAYINKSKTWRGAIEANDLQNTGTAAAVMKTKYRFIGTIDGATLKQQLNASTGSYTFANPQTTHEFSNYLFGLHYNDDFTSPSKARLYQARIYTNSVVVGERVLARDYRPAYKRATKEYGLYDCVSGEFFPSGSTTPFTGAPPKLPGLMLLFW